MTFGPDSLISGAGAIDIGSPERAGTAVGVINGMGSCGALLPPILVPYMKKRLWLGFDILSVRSLCPDCRGIVILPMEFRWHP